MKTKQLKLKRNRLQYCEKLLSKGLTEREIIPLLNTFSVRNKNYWLERDYSIEESVMMARSRTPGTIEYYKIYKNLSEEQSKKAVIEYQSNKVNTLENFIRKHGQEEGDKRFKSYCEKQAYSNTLEYMIKKYGEEAGTNKYYTANKNRAVTLENCIKKHGNELGAQIYSNYVKKQRTNGKSLEYFIQKLGKDAGTCKYITLNKQKAQTYNNYLIRNNGDVEKAAAAFDTYCKNRYNSVTTKRGVSASSQDFFGKLHMELIKLGIEKIFYASYNQEWIINIIGKRVVYLDFFVKSLGKVIEYNGDYYHANPTKFKSTDKINCYGKERLVELVWSDEKSRLDDIRSVPYIKDILVIWEGEVNDNEHEVIKKCIQFLLK
jgi:hypothetical protein